MIGEETECRENHTSAEIKERAENALNVAGIYSCRIYSFTLAHKKGKTLISEETGCRENHTSLKEAKRYGI